MKRTKVYIMICIIFVSVFIISLCTTTFYYNESKHLLNQLSEFQREEEFRDSLGGIRLENLDVTLDATTGINVYFGRSNCSDCSLFDRSLIDLLQSDSSYRLFYVDLEEYHLSASKDDWTEFKDRYNFSETPAIVRFENGKKIDIIQQNGDQGISMMELKSFLLKYDWFWQLVFSIKIFSRSSMVRWW